MYKGLSLDVIHFEAQDVITSSIGLNKNCVCTSTDSPVIYRHFDESGVPCTADVHNHTCNNSCEYITP